jgi:hypothetical protein
MEHDKNAIISDADGIVGRDEGTLDADGTVGHDEGTLDTDGTVGHNEGTLDAGPKEIMPNPYILARNMCVVQLKQRFTEVERSAQEL